MPRQDDIVWYLTIDDRRIEGVLLLVAEGRMSNDTSPDFERKLTAAMEPGIRGAVVDLSGVDYISSAGLRVLEAAAARLAGAGRLLVVCGVQDAVNAAFRLAGFAGVVIERTREQAIARLTDRDSIDVLGPLPE